MAKGPYKRRGSENDISGLVRIGSTCADAATDLEGGLVSDLKAGKPRGELSGLG